MKRTKLILPLFFTAAASVSMIFLNSNDAKAPIITAYLLFLVFHVVYIISGSKTNPLIYIVPFTFVYVEMTTPIAKPFFYVFRIVLPGTPYPDQSLLSALVAAFFGSGLMEELMKAFPVLICLYLARRSTGSVAPALRYLGFFRCLTPLEGMLLGLAAGAGFAYVETLYQMASENGVYVSNPDNYYESLIPLAHRIRQAVIGNMTRTGIAGFFIGLSARHPRSIVVLLAIGWLLPAILHMLWNVWGDEGRWVKNGMSVLIFIACFIRAKQLDDVATRRERKTCSDEIECSEHT